MSRDDMSFAIAAGHDLTARTGADVLRAGGNAVDAAIAAALTACVVEPIMASPLGGGFLTLHWPDGETKVLDFFGHTPQRAPEQSALEIRSVDADFGRRRQVFHIGAGTIAVPGIASGFAEALNLYGRMGMPELAQDAVRYACEGVEMNAFQAEVLQIIAPVVQATAEIKALFTNESGALLGEGEILRNPDMGAALEAWAREGLRFMTEGEGARALLDQCRAGCSGGALTEKDLRDYRPIWRDPLVVEHRGARLAINPPPSAGGALVALILSLLERVDESDPPSLARALACAHEARKRIGHDEDPSKGMDLLVPSLASSFAKEIVGHPPSFNGTTHISLIDGEGLGAALTLTNGSGSGLIASGTGMHINDMLGEPDLVPPASGAFPENVRLCSMMAPAALTCRRGLVMLGSAGSTRIPSAIVQALLPILDDDQNCADAVAAPRIHIEDEADFENFFGQEAHDRLKEMFPDAHAWDEKNVFFGGVNLAARWNNGDDGEMDAASDPRRDGGVFHASNTKT